MQIRISTDKILDESQVITLYEANEWSSAKKPKQLLQALLHSHTLVTAYNNEHLIGLGNAISDGFLVVYYPHLLVLPEFQGQGIGKMILEKMQEIYKEFHMQMLTADGRAIDFYQKNGFTKAGETQSMWIYQGNEH